MLLIVHMANRIDKYCCEILIGFAGIYIAAGRKIVKIA